MAEGDRADQLRPVEVTVQTPLYHIGDAQLADCCSPAQPARGEHPAAPHAAKTFCFGNIAACGGRRAYRQRGEGGLGVAQAVVQQVLSGVGIVGIRFPVCPAAMMPAGRLVFGAALGAVLQGYEETGLGVGLGPRFGEPVIGIQSFPVTYPV